MCVLAVVNGCAGLSGRRERRERELEREQERAKAREVEQANRAMALSEKEKINIKQQYLGKEKTKKKTLKPNERMSKLFDWDEAEDTTDVVNPIFSGAKEVTLLFGRGLRGGKFQE